MNCIDSIVKYLVENKITETIFVYNGAEYENRFGNYTKNRKPISRAEYHAARKSVLAQNYDEKSIDYTLQLPHKELANAIESIDTFINNLDYDEEYETFKEKRGHIERISTTNIEGRISQIVADTGVSEVVAKKMNDILSEYTSTNNYTRFNKEEKELLDLFIDNSPVYYPPPLYRGIGFREKLGGGNLNRYEAFKELEEGAILVLPDYTSFSSNPDVAVEFAYANGDHKIYIVNTKNLTGVSIDYLSSISYKEDEILYKADTRLILKDKLIEGNVIYLHVEEASLEDDEESINVVDIPVKGSMYIE